MKICLVSDTWDNVNGVCTTLKNTVRELTNMGHEVLVIEPSQFETINMPTYPEVKLSLNLWKVGKKIRDFNPDSIHIATEGTLGIAARWYCKVKRRNIPHNSSYHTMFPEYIHQHYKLPLSWGYAAMRLFHKYSSKVLVTTESMRENLADRGFERLAVWSRGVDMRKFNPDSKIGNMNIPRPVLLCVSRASQEKGLDDFCQLETTGSKIMIGDGPYLSELKSKYPDVRFLGYKHGSVLAHFYANADVFVFPSKTDTFGIVMLEAIACGTPIAAYPVIGPIDVVVEGINGSLNNDLSVAIENAMKCNRCVVADYAKKYSWRACTETFLANLTSIH